MLVNPSRKDWFMDRLDLVETASAWKCTETASGINEPVRSASERQDRSGPRSSN
jgi:hypothetical protein